MRDFSLGNSDAMDILTLGLGLGLGRMLGLELGRQDVPGLKNIGVNFLAQVGRIRMSRTPVRQGDFVRGGVFVHLG